MTYQPPSVTRSLIRVYILILAICIAPPPHTNTKKSSCMSKTWTTKRRAPRRTDNFWWAEYRRAWWEQRPHITNLFRPFSYRRLNKAKIVGKILIKKYLSYPVRAAGEGEIKTIITAVGNIFPSHYYGVSSSRVDNAECILINYLDSRLGTYRPLSFSVLYQMSVIWNREPH